MSPGYETDTYHVGIEYEFKGQARGDEQMRSVLDVISRKVFHQAHHTLSSGQSVKKESEAAGVNLKPKESQVVENVVSQQAVVDAVISAIREKRYSEATQHFTTEGLERYNKLIAYGLGRVVGTPHIQFFRGLDGHSVARGLQMSFSFGQGKRKTFVEDVVLTLNADNKIDNVTFGLGQVAANDILCKREAKWSDDTREMLMEFLENYKTAYCLKDIGYLETVFSDNAVIIVGNVVRQATKLSVGSERQMTAKGEETIRYNRYTKDQYLKNLRRCFARNEFINIRFSNNTVQMLDKYMPREEFGIQIGQEYNSATYADKGYLFLHVDMTDHDKPLIKIRTWQPNEVSMDKIYDAGFFYDE